MLHHIGALIVCVERLLAVETVVDHRPHQYPCGEIAAHTFSDGEWLVRGKRFDAGLRSCAKIVDPLGVAPFTKAHDLQGFPLRNRHTLHRRATNKLQRHILILTKQEGEQPILASMLSGFSTLAAENAEVFHDEVLTHA